MKIFKLLALIVIASFSFSIFGLPLANAEDSLDQQILFIKDHLEDYEDSAYPPRSFNEARIYTETCDHLGVEPERRFVQYLKKVLKKPESEQSKGLSIDKRSEPTIWETAYGIEVAQNLDLSPLIKTDALTAWLVSRQDKNGGFIETTETEPTLKATAGAVKALKSLGHPELVNSRTVNWIINLRRQSGGFSLPPIKDSIVGTELAVTSLADLGAIDKLREDKTRRFILNLQTNNFGFREDPGQQNPSLKATYYAIHALALLNSLEHIDKDQGVQYVRKFYRPGGFAAVLESPGIESISTLYGLSILTMIAGNISGHEDKNIKTLNELEKKADNAKSERKPVNKRWPGLIIAAILGVIGIAIILRETLSPE